MKILRIAGIISFAVALFQAVISFSPSWSLFFGAPKEIVVNAATLFISGIVVAIIFTIFGLYGLSGAGNIRPLPFLRWGLVFIGAIYTLRGLLLILQLLILFEIVKSEEMITPQLIASSIISLIIGNLYLIGTKSRWDELRRMS